MVSSSQTSFGFFNYFFWSPIKKKKNPTACTNGFLGGKFLGFFFSLWLLGNFWSAMFTALFLSLSQSTLLDFC